METFGIATFDQQLTLNGIQLNSSANNDKSLGELDIFPGSVILLSVSIFRLFFRFSWSSGSSLPVYGQAIWKRHKKNDLKYKHFLSSKNRTEFKSCWDGILSPPDALINLSFDELCPKLTTTTRWSLAHDDDDDEDQSGARIMTSAFFLSKGRKEDVAEGWSLILILEPWRTALHCSRWWDDDVIVWCWVLYVAEMRRRSWWRGTLIILNPTDCRGNFYVSWSVVFLLPVVTDQSVSQTKWHQIWPVLSFHWHLWSILYPRDVSN